VECGVWSLLVGVLWSLVFFGVRSSLAFYGVWDLINCDWGVFIDKSFGAFLNLLLGFSYSITGEMRKRYILWV